MKGLFKYVEKPLNPKEVEQIIKRVDSYKVCEGGPSSDLYDEIYSESAYRDVSAGCWRHKDCHFLASNSMPRCINCAKVLNTLRKAEKLQSDTGRQLKRVRCSSSARMSPKTATARSEQIAVKHKNKKKVLNRMNSIV